jgi:hypothetical protein
MKSYIEAVIITGLAAILGIVLTYLEITYPTTSYVNIVLVILIILAFFFEILPESMPRKVWKSLDNFLRK